jgi:hypothetical protein
MSHRFVLINTVAFYMINFVKNEDYNIGYIFYSNIDILMIISFKTLSYNTD